MQNSCSWAFSIKNIFFLLLMMMAFFTGCRSDKDSYRTWRVYKGDPTSSSYSALDQINKNNVGHLKVAWTYRTGDLKENHPRTGIETNPIIVDGILYAASPHLKVFAVDGETGEKRWKFDPFQGKRSIGKLRSVVYWEEDGDKRILFTAGTWLYALNAETGELISSFGQKGKVSLNKGLGRDPDSISVRYPSPGIIYKDLIILGSKVAPGYGSAPGYIRAYNVKTGVLTWTFHTIPKPGEFGYETWGDIDSTADRRGGVNSWAGMSLDKERGIVYAPTGSPNYDFYGGDRPGKNLYGNSLMALDAATGKLIWYYQTIHHGLWDYDLPAPPNLVTVKKNGKKIDAVAQVTKHGFTFVFNRVTGDPVFPIEERPVPQSHVKGEQSWSTQPFPTKPEPYVRQHYKRTDVPDRSQEVHDSVLAKLNKYRNEGLFTPPDPQGSIVLPRLSGGANWGGAAYDPQKQVLYVNASEEVATSTVQNIRSKVSQSETLVEKGRTFYVQNCATCHGINLEGNPPDYPELRGIKQRNSKEEVRDRIEEGGSMMPPFSALSKKKKNAIVAYLFNRNKTKESDQENNKEAKSGEGQYRDLTSHGQFLGPDGYPAIKPPWGTLNAIDLNSGKIKWKVPLGAYPELTKQGIPPTGLHSWGGPIVTAGGLVFIAGTENQKFCAFDKETGKLLWETTLPAAGFATPATYMIGGQQYVVIAAGGGRGSKPGDYYIAFALSKS